MTTFGATLVGPQKHRMPDVVTSPAPREQPSSAARPLSRVAAADVLTCTYLVLIGLLATVFAERIP